MIQTTEVSITYKGDGVQTSFPYPYPYRNSDDIVGYIINDVGYEKRITNNFKYDKVSNIYQYPLAGDPLAAPYSIKLIRETPQQQNADLPGKLPFSLIEKSLDWIIMILQEIGSRCNSLWHIRNDCKLSETNARNSETNAKASETNAKASETNAANSAKQAAESAGVFQDFKGATADTDGNGGKVPKPLAGQQDKVLKADGTWGDSVTPKTLWECLHSYSVNYVPSDVSNAGWNSLGFCAIYYTEFKINHQPTQYGQLINIPADSNQESTQLWIVQDKGTILSRGGSADHPVDDTPFKYVGIDVDTGHLKFPNGAEMWVS
ncbi:hypothetical protein [Megasphaera sp.]|uniref:hypothetical protein n=1 Tax=Megasphaera sp. TaxID=2023260 RepID=UPI003078BABE